jgi:hypothetical protein
MRGPRCSLARDLNKAIEATYTSVSRGGSAGLNAQIGASTWPRLKAVAAPKEGEVPAVDGVYLLIEIGPAEVDTATADLAVLNLSVSAHDTDGSMISTYQYSS